MRKTRPATFVRLLEFSMTRLDTAIQRLYRWHVAGALPVWAEAAVDENGSFIESLDFSGRAILGQPRRVRVQSRQVYTFSEAARRGWLERGEEIAARGFRRLVETACPGAAARGCVHLINDAGGIVDDRRDLYDQAFLLLACAARLAAGDRAAAEIVESTLTFLDAELASPFGGYLESDHNVSPRRQNPHMHLFEAMMALFAATGDAQYLLRARALEDLFNTRFLDRNFGVLREFFRDDWTIDAQKGDFLEPGHMVEWVFLLDQFEALSGEDRGEEKQMLFHAALSARAGDDYPFLPNCKRIETDAKRDARRLWPQLEALKAAVIMDRCNMPNASSYAADLIDGIFEEYFDEATPGIWRDEIDKCGQPSAHDVPASILYHLQEAVSCASKHSHKTDA